MVYVSLTCLRTSYLRRCTHWRGLKFQQAYSGGGQEHTQTPHYYDCLIWQQLICLIHCRGESYYWTLPTLFEDRERLAEDKTN